MGAVVEMDHTTVATRNPLPTPSNAGLSHHGPRYAGSGGHPNSYVARKTCTQTSCGTISYDKNPLEDRFGRLSRYEGLAAVIAQMIEFPNGELRGVVVVVAAMANHPDSKG